MKQHLDLVIARRAVTALEILAHQVDAPV